jgi:hypothetical protein
MPFLDAAFPLPNQVVKQLAQVLANLAEQSFLAVLGDEHNLLFSFPFFVA